MTVDTICWIGNCPTATPRESRLSASLSALCPTCDLGKGSVRADSELWPVRHLHSCNQLIFAALWLEDRRFTLLDIKPFLAQGVDDVGLVRDEEVVLALGRSPRQHFAESFRSPVVFIRCHHQAALGQVDCPLDVLESCQDGRLVGTIELACVDLADRQTDPANCIAKRL